MLVIYIHLDPQVGFQALENIVGLYRLVTEEWRDRCMQLERSSNYRLGLFLLEFFLRRSKKTRVTDKPLFIRTPRSSFFLKCLESSYSRKTSACSSSRILSLLFRCDESRYPRNGHSRRSRAREDSLGGVLIDCCVGDPGQN